MIQTMYTQSVYVSYYRYQNLHKYHNNDNLYSPKLFYCTRWRFVERRATNSIWNLWRLMNVL